LWQFDETKASHQELEAKLKEGGWLEGYKSTVDLLEQNARIEKLDKRIETQQAHIEKQDKTIETQQAYISQLAADL
jgi:hypothetical protein